MSSSLKLDRLIAALQALPGIGPRSASRIAYTLLSRRREEGLNLAAALTAAMQQIKLCPSCRNYSDGGLCRICADPKRKISGLLCIVESPSDVEALERAEVFDGLYFVLHGHLSPIDGVGPADLGLAALEEKFKAGGIKEVILATNSTVEGNATASYIAALARRYQINTSRLASGVPLGGEVDSVDGNTLAASLAYRRPF